MKILVAILTLCAFLTSCSGGNPLDLEPPVVAWGEVEQKLTESAGRFGFDLFQELAVGDQDNLFFSPLSVSMALGMTYLGARGQTAEAFEHTLRLEGLTPDQIRQGYRNLLDSLPILDQQVEINLANSVWYNLTIMVLQSFIDDVSRTFDAQVEGLYFSSPNAVDVINEWVRENTNGRITSIVDHLDPLEALVLANAIYFDAPWTFQFDPKDTWDLAFETPGGEKTVPTMYMHADLDYLSHELFQAVRLPYGESRRLAMTVMLPRPDVTMNELISTLEADSFASWQQQFHTRSGHLWLPRCEVRYQNTELLPVLESMGLVQASAPDFTGISPEPLFLSRVIHKAFLKVDEAGTEAAVVTAVIMDAGCSGEDCSSGEEFYLQADRPFLLVIHDQPTGALLFLGRISDP